MASANSAGSRLRHEESGARRRRPATAGRRRRWRRPGCRTPPPRARRARSSRCDWARSPRRPPGSRSTGCGAAGVGRTGPGRRARARRRAGAHAPTSPSPSTPLAPPDDQQQRFGPAELVRAPGSRRRAPSTAGSVRRTGSPARRSARPIAAARPDCSPGAKKACSTPGATISILPLRVAVQPAELLLLLDAADAHGVGAVDQLGLGAVAPTRFGVAAFGLDPRQGVERRHERDVEHVLDAVRDDAAQPVVGVHDVGPAGGGDVGEHARR